jgi:hypothetical protein
VCIKATGEHHGETQPGEGKRARRSGPPASEKVRGKQKEDRMSATKAISVTEATERGIENADNSEYTDGHNIGP